MHEPPWWTDVAMPVLLAEARRVYGRAIAQALHEHGFDDIPRGGARVIGTIANNGPLADDALDRTGLASSRVPPILAALAEHGYVDSSPPPHATHVLTPRGRDAAQTIAAAVSHTDQRIAERTTPDAITVLRDALGRLIDDTEPHT